MGCGLDKRPREEGWVNVDVRPEVDPDLIHDISKPFTYGDNTVDEILAKDILEHITWRRVPDVLREWRRILKPGGKIYIQCPNLWALASKILSEEMYRWEQISFWVYGEQSEGESETGGHKAGFTIPALSMLLTEIGFKVESCQSDGGSNIMLWAHKR